ncbi:MAG: alanine racemase [Myxococcota bacterium]|jgi:alanine racemase|nr:alanine racemase [Myxococcota bacterium]
MSISSTISHATSWAEIDGAALRSNVDQFRRIVGDRVLLAVVKANAYGHGSELVSREALAAGADWLGVFAIREGLALRASGIEAPILVLGPPMGDVSGALSAGLRLTVSSLNAAQEVAKVGLKGARLHLKLETGTNRQGLLGHELGEAASILSSSGAIVEGACTHFADIEDTTDHDFAQKQLARFEERLEELRSLGNSVPLPHAACSAATILFPSTHFAMVRVGISLYGLWPSRETFVSARTLGRAAISLRPALTWKTRIAQIKKLGVGEYVGYGRTYRATHQTRIAVLPIGYADGYDRGLSSGAHVLVRGVRAPVRGRICMNMTLVDVTDIPQAQDGDEVVLLGDQGEEKITAEDLARLAGTINYEIVARISPDLPRVLV